ncbi:beta-lactamase/transpeptidase-like protein [Aspergillus avenaceus]|uniref:Beta-lactamase/transpeptidase-like protein n=1 Tax=Aspergillus avenaceus TaxID=36643 RepID=A0A5N6U1Z4_ASPAV|nr:beta-lactamase/transpeptidase-like protein [Aspergillus avenaceus]
MPSRPLSEIFEAVQSRYRGPGGAIAVLKDGEPIGEFTWGYADMQQRIPMASSTLIPICSITKQMVCLLLEDIQRNPTPDMAKRGSVRQQLTDGLHRLLGPGITENTGITLEHLCNNQSGIRDYWAMSVLWGSQPDGVFKHGEDAQEAIKRTKSLHFQPGTQYAYCNLNFYILARLLEDVTGQTLGDLLVERLFSPAQMNTATLCEDNAKLPLPIVGYEGSEASGYFTAINRMQWSGDAGVVASLEDMIAYERYLDKAWHSQESSYRAITQTQSFEDGKVAGYGYGLRHSKVGGIATFGHGGALRGFRLHRVQAPSERLSVITLLNHEASAQEAAGYILKAMLDMPEMDPLPMKHASPVPSWTGSFFDPDAQLAVRVRLGDGPRVIIYYERSDETLICINGGEKAESSTMKATISGDRLTLHRLVDNRLINAERICGDQQPPKNDYLGTYYSADADSTFHCTGVGALLYGSFDGFLGHGPVHLMRYLGNDIWTLACPRALDAQPPGDWTVVFQRDIHGKIESVVIGCWLARRIAYVRR